ncbi:TerB-C domain-containing protein [Sphingobacterium nematocida]|uniref:TerB-C domain-containing protein n=1 Tax=Sphingobacterium nematocida TaxID=1513896 RepID=A0A1T5GI37_9SPHI|nr:tellurite resistance TerB C-terminal domain-containing protein [Sphingobacterium nematocida]SKC07987.1 TerB-C domain-containing protein [Sphingobacterium nematocida]
MEAFFGILLLFIIIWVTTNKKSKQKGFSSIPSAGRNSGHYPPTLPLQNNSDAYSYFGDNWKNYLTKHHGKYVLWPSNFFEIVGLALLKLSITEKYLLRQDVKSSEREQLLYQLTLTLLKNDKFSVENMVKGFRMIIESRKTGKPAPPRQDISQPITRSKNQIFDTDVVHAVPPPLPNTAPPIAETIDKSNLIDNEIDKAYVSKDFVCEKTKGSSADKHIELVNDIRPASSSNMIMNRESIIDVDNNSESLIYRKEETSIEQETTNGTTKPISIDDILNNIKAKYLTSSSENTPSEPERYESFPSTTHDGYEYDNWKLGKRFKDKMGLSRNQVSLVNKVTGIHNVFTSVDGCCMQTISVFLEVVKRLEKKLKKQESSVKSEIEKLTQSAIQINRNTGEGYWYFYDDYGRKNFPIRIEEEVYTTIFKRTENVVRDRWGHKRKVSGDYSSYFTGLADEFNKRLGNYVDEILPVLISLIVEPDFETELELNKQNTTRWKVKLDTLKQNLTEDTAGTFAQSIHTLFEENSRNQSGENIFFEASKIIAPYDKIEAVRLYLYYVNADIKSDKIDDKQLTKTVQKRLFNNDQHQSSFIDIVTQLKKDKNILAAIKKANSIYEPVRKKISLNLETIKTVKEQDRNTVDLLNTLLQDEIDIENHTPAALNTTAPTDTVAVVVNSMPNVPPSSEMIVDIELNRDQIKLIQLFAANGFSLEQQEIAEYAQRYGLRSGPLVNNINEICYEVLDDNLLEERDEDYFEMNEEYYNMIIKT